MNKNMLFGKKYCYFGKTQGVGFRPTVWKVAKLLKLNGKVYNNHECAVVELWASKEKHSNFKKLLKDNLPKAAYIEKINETFIKDADTPKNFSIIKSKLEGNAVNILPDLAICSDCTDELFDTKNKRYGYPLNNCTQCGPRFSIIYNTPYDRSRTSMSRFKMCKECKNEYENPEDRRFHAQPIACDKCGPKVTLEKISKFKDQIQPELIWEQLDKIKNLFLNDKIIAIQGIGGFHLACNAKNHEIIEKLRLLKNRYEKPFAVMGKDIEMIKRYCFVTQSENKLLISSESPIVLLKKRNVDYLPKNIAPGQKRLGFMLPYSPIHKLLFHEIDFPLLMTSANLSDEPQCISVEEVRERLNGIVDYIFWHERKIINRLDDSVIQINRKKLVTYRRARGFAPSPIKLPPGFDNEQYGIGLGAEIKSTFCLLNKGDLVLSPHLGDLSEGRVDNEFRSQVKRFLDMYRIDPNWVSIDLHPDYRSTIFGKLISEQKNIKVFQVQHHHAHLAACMAENGLPKHHDKIFGVALDGMGYGTDGTMWGGEFFITNYTDYERFACFKPIPLLGGNQAMRQPWRNTLSNLLTYFEFDELKSNYKDLDLIQYLESKPIITMNEMFKQSLLTSSCGRIFDAVAAAVGICRDSISFEGQAAMKLESIVQKQSYAPYPISIERADADHHFKHLNLKRMWIEILNDLYKKISPSIISAKFHQGLSTVISNLLIEMNYRKKKEIDITNVVALSGGVFQNQILKDLTENKLKKANFTVITHQKLPSNDGCIALGQAVIATARNGNTNKSDLTL